MNLTGAKLSLIRARHPGCEDIRIFAETGTYYGDRAAMAADQFDHVYTVELSPILWATASHTYGGRNIVFEQGDSRHVVPRWAIEFQEPVCWLLDAHWFDVNARRTRAGAQAASLAQVAGKDDTLPLWEELDAIASRKYLDVVIVDDVRDFGTDKPTPEWLEVSLERIADFFPGHREAVILADQAVVYR